LLRALNRMADRFEERADDLVELLGLENGPVRRYSRNDRAKVGRDNAARVRYLLGHHGHLHLRGRRSG